VVTQTYVLEVVQNRHKHAGDQALRKMDVCVRKVAEAEQVSVQHLLRCIVVSVLTDFVLQDKDQTVVLFVTNVVAHILLVVTELVLMLHVAGLYHVKVSLDVILHVCVCLKHTLLIRQVCSQPVADG
jgi:hypothetical protein